MEDTQKPELMFPPRLLQQNQGFWHAQLPRPQRTTEPFAHPSAAFKFHQYREGNQQMALDRIIAAASCLLGEHWWVLRIAAELMAWECGIKASGWPISIMLSAAYRTMPESVYDDLEPPDHAYERERLDQVQIAAWHLVCSQEDMLTAAARQVLLEPLEMAEERWIMEVLKTSTRIRQMVSEGTAHEQLDVELRLPWHRGVFSVLSGVQAAEWLWLQRHSNRIWPYRQPEAQFILDQHQAAQQRDAQPAVGA